MKIANYKTVVIAAVFFLSATAARSQEKPVPMPGPSIYMLPGTALPSRPLPKFSFPNPDQPNFPNSVIPDFPNPHLRNPNLPYSNIPNLTKPATHKPGIYYRSPDNMPCLVPNLRNVTRMPVQLNQPWLPQPK